MATKEIRPVRLWAVHYGNGSIDPHSIRMTRREAIAAFLSDPAMPDWPYWRWQGCRAVKVIVCSPPAAGEG